VVWDEHEIARDLLQNFRDANKHRMDQISVHAEGALVVVYGPVSFAIERLFYLGSEKDPDAGDIGRYGEGFKAAATCLIRDHHVEPIFASGKALARVRADGKVVADTKLTPLVYDFWELDRPIEGTRLWLPGCGPKLVSAMLAGLEEFFWPGNRLLGKLVWNAWGREFALYEANGTDGSIFYRGLRRAAIDGVGLVIVIDREVAAIEKLMGKDRDRKAFGTKVREKAYAALARSGLRNQPDEAAVVAILEATRHLWQQGHPLLREIADHCQVRMADKKVEAIFGPRAFALQRVGFGSLPEALAAETRRREEEWRKEGWLELPSYFSEFGVRSAVAELQEQANRERQRQRRAPTNAEALALDVLRRATLEVAPDIDALFTKLNTRYTVAPNAEMLGEFRRSRAYNSHEIFLDTLVFELDFPEAFATFLHEHAHALGYDGDRAFTDALTAAIATLIRIRGRLDDPERRWAAAREGILAERKKLRDEGREDSATTVAALDEAGLRRLISRIAPAVVSQALNDAPHDQRDNES
jgi:hypothetical protein